jgi:hypothetical protein
MYTSEELKSRAEQLRQESQRLASDAEQIDKLLASGIDISHIGVLMGFSVPVTGAVPTITKKVGRPSTKVVENPSLPDMRDESETVHRTQPSLKSLILDVLSKKKDGLKLHEIVEDVLKTGYISTASLSTRIFTSFR